MAVIFKLWSLCSVNLFYVVMFGSLADIGDGPAQSVTASGCAGNSLLNADLASTSPLSDIIANCSLLPFCK